MGINSDVTYRCERCGKYISSVIVFHGLYLCKECKESFEKWLKTPKE